MEGDERKKGKEKEEKENLPVKFPRVLFFLFFFVFF